MCCKVIKFNVIFQSGSTQHIMIGVQLLSQLVVEMNQVSEVRLMIITSVDDIAYINLSVSH